ncbi:MAG: NTP transferase domain-containing protein, partial [Gammaproteobacteria bacterium]|nr:NTP transferase domain-containing protein [Gemmatimonadota bacterium]NIU78149.1 NTP transferase domain-containing protein [Gammaproteobacteria bacterium]NIX21778.1 NTP transferase domain-containing protein [Actinomycetota bacterium]
SADVWAVIVAGGRGRRFGAPEPKQFTPLAGQPMVLWPVSVFQGHPDVAGLVLVVPEAYATNPPRWLGALAESGVRLAA